MIMLKIFFGIHFCKHAKMTQINLFNPLSMVLKPVWCLDSEAKETQIQTGEKLVEKLLNFTDKWPLSIEQNTSEGENSILIVLIIFPLVT